MRKSAVAHIRLLAVLLALVVVANACTRTPPGEVTFGEGAEDFGEFSDLPEVDGSGSGQLPDDDLDFDGGPQPEGTAEGPGAPPGGNGQGTAGTATPGQPAPEDRAAPPATSVEGIEGGKIKFVYATQLQSCGDDPTTANQGVANDKGLNVLSEWVGWFNENLLAEIGYELEYEVVDDGGPFCPERTQAAASQIVREIRPFAVLSNHVQPARGPVMADAVTRAGIVHIGTSWSTNEAIRERAPLAWPTGPTTERLLENLAGWAGQRIRGTQVGNPVTGVPEERVYGILALDNPEGRQLGARTKAYVEQRGMAVNHVYVMSGDPGVAAQQATNLALRMRSDGVNTLIFGVPLGAINSTIVLSEVMNAQNYRPDILVGTYGLALFDGLHNRRVWSNAKGTTQMTVLVLRWAIRPGPGGFEVVEDFEEVPENEFAYIRVWQDQLGHNDNPQDDSAPPAYDTWTQLSLLVTGIMHAEGALTPEGFAQGVHSARRGGPNRCTVGRFMGRDYEYSGGFHWEYGASGMRNRSTSVYWVNRQTPFGTNGYWESYDNYRFFGADEWPAEHTRDTGVHGLDVPKQERIGLRPWTPCSQFPNYPRS